MEQSNHKKRTDESDHGDNEKEGRLEDSNGNTKAALESSVDGVEEFMGRADVVVRLLKVSIGNKLSLKLLKGAKCTPKGNSS
jgi:hypothetical protein